MRYRVLQDFGKYKAGDIMDVDGDMGPRIELGQVEPVVVVLDADRKKPRKVQLRVSDVHLKVGST